MELPSSKALIRQIKAAAREEKLSADEIIVRTVKRTGIQPSTSTVRRLLEVDSEEKYGFRYEDILRPVYLTLLGDRGDCDDPAVLAKLQLYEEVIGFSEQFISFLLEENRQLRQQVEAARRDYDKAREFFLGQISHKDKQMLVKDERMDKKDAVIEARDAELAELREKLREMENA